MTRCSFVLLSVLLLGTMAAPAVWGQESSGRMSLAERMAALRRGWLQDEADQAPAQREAAASQPRSAPPQAETGIGSLLPDWFSRRDDAPAPTPSGRHSPRRTMPAQRTASAPARRAGSAQSARSNASEIALPGLGGSPLPQGDWTTARKDAAAERDGSQEIISDYPVVGGKTEDVRANAGVGNRSANRRPSSAAAVPTTSAPVRQSPNSRPTPQIDPDELRRELSGSFTGSSGRRSPAPRTARANGHAAAQQTSPEITATDEPSSAPQQTERDVPMTLPTVENSPSFGSGSAPDTSRPLRAPATTPTGDSSTDHSTRPPADSPDVKSAFTNSQFVRSPQMSGQPERTRSIRGQRAFGEALQVANGGDPSVLVSNQAPIITADIRGPKQILVGREAVYRVRLQNAGDGAAEGVVATIRIPSWAEVVDSIATQGTIQPSQGAAAPTQLEWQLARLDGRDTETLDLRLVPRESRPLELGISWTLAPIGSRAIVEVQEPKLNIEVDGPNEVLFDKPQVFRLTLSNPGTGPAESVTIELVPPGGAPEAASSHTIGDLLPGDSKTVEIELTAREAGKLIVKAIASAEGGLTADVAKEIFCRKAELELDWRGPATQYAGTPATYFFRVRNPGTAPADDVTLQVTLPEGAEFTSASAGQTYDPQQRQVSWRVGTLEPGDDNYMELKCVVKKPGANQLQVTAGTSSGDLTDSVAAETNVVALADLKLEVADPRGPIAVGSPAVYEIRVANRGASAAKNVEVVALFSEGIDPDHAEGAMYTVADGRVSFRTIDELPAGRELTLRIRAQATQPGTHVFRAEVLCRDAEIKLAAEETTRFYTDASEPLADDAQQQADNRNPFESAVR